MPKLIDPDIIKLAMRGDTSSFRKVVEGTQGFVYAVAYRLLGNVTDAEDATQEAFVKLWKNMAKYNPEIKLTTWLYRIVTNVCLDELKSSRRKHDQKTVDITTAQNIANDQTEQTLEKTEMINQIQEAAAMLTPKQKAVFVLRDLEQLSVEEVGVILDLNAAQIKSNLYLARQSINKKLKEYLNSKSVSL
jgi:RNA polymerase sigma-70 factor (ECF subfamily)